MRPVRRLATQLPIDPVTLAYDKGHCLVPLHAVASSPGVHLCDQC